MHIRANNGFQNQDNKRILFPEDKHFDSISLNEGFVKKIRFHYAKKLLSPARISKTNHPKWFKIVEERLLYKNGFTLI